jgi:hypothetical protein
MKLRGLTVCVEYDDLLKITLPQNLQHFDECLVITSSADTRTQELVKKHPKAKLFVTDSFYEYGASFNKGLAIELGFNALGREGWIVVWDADIIFPEVMPLNGMMIGNLYGPHRRILNDPRQWSPALQWSKCVRARDLEIPGYFQLFHADDAVLQSRPWYDISFGHAGGGDSFFQSKWNKQNRIKLPFDVLHLGPRDSNWYGRTTERTDGIQLQEVNERKKKLELLHKRKGWCGHKRDRSIPNTDRINVPGFDESNYDWHGDLTDASTTGDDHNPMEGQGRSETPV